jgi:hypothetical protein
MKVLTVQKLINELLKVENKKLPVWLEGCDCNSEAAKLKIYNEKVLIKNTDSFNPNRRF